MVRNAQFFQQIWPVISEQVTRHRAGADDDVLPLLRRLGLRRGARVLDVPCGFGRHALVLARCGYRVTGVDISPELLAQARAACSGAARGSRRGIFRHVPSSHRRNRPLQNPPEFIRGDIRRLRFRGQFDLVLNLFTSFGYFGDRDDQRVLDSFYRALRPSGRAVVHAINRDYIVRHYRPRSVSRLKDFRLDERVAMDWATSTIRTEWTVRFRRGSALLARFSRRGKSKARRLKPAPRVRGVTHLRIYSCHELKAMLERAGFRRVQAFGGFRGEPVSMNRRWLLLIGQR
ncbi:MAG: class I SAM-dependent methyltransferase [Candidatus Acidiferrales bacterium]